MQGGHKHTETWHEEGMEGARGTRHAGGMRVGAHRRRGRGARDIAACMRVYESWHDPLCRVPPLPFLSAPPPPPT